MVQDNEETQPEPSPLVRHTSDDVPAVIDSLPAGRPLGREEVRALALTEGYSTTAVELAQNDGRTTIGQRLRTLLLTVLFCGAVLWFFPLERFFKPPLQPMSEVALTAHLTDNDVEQAEAVSRPILEARRTMEWMATTNLTGAIEHARATLDEVPEAERKAWKEVYYRYWQYLERSIRHRELETSLRQFIGIDPNDPVFAWYYARVFNRKAAQGVLRNTADASQILIWLQRSENQIEEQLSRDTTLDDAGRQSATARVRLLRLEKARVHHNLWRIYDYTEKAPGRAHRDEAIRLCAAMENDLEAQRLLLHIYDRVLDQWWFFERSEVLADETFHKARLRTKRDALQAAVREALQREQVEKEKALATP